MAKLSDIKGDRVFDVIADLIEPITNIAQDETAADLFTKKELPEGMDAQTFTLARIKKALPSLLREHKQDLLIIFATINGVSVEEYEKDLSLAKLLSDFGEIVTDESLLAFFD